VCSYYIKTWEGSIYQGKEAEQKGADFEQYIEEQYSVRAIKARASGYITNSSASEELLEVIRMALSGEKRL
jgi:hypothetical protein